MTFQLPDEIPADAVRDLERACVAGGPDNMPWPTELKRQDGRLSVRKAVDESGYFLAPWPVDSVGRLMTSSATLMERAAVYQLLTELTRGKVNQVRNQAADWVAGGLQLPPQLQDQIQAAATAFGRVVTQEQPAAASRLAALALTLGFQTARQLVQTYVDQVFAVREQHGKLDTTFGCRLGATIPSPAVAAELVHACTTLCVPIAWHIVEADETTYRWKETDALVEWAVNQGLPASAGPLIDFSSAQFPAWVWQWERDVPSMATFMCRFVEAAVRRYRNRIRRWHMTAASNCASILGLGEDELLGLTYRLVETARQVDPSLELVIGISQPWGEYMAQADRTHSPFIFADTLIRSGLNLTALDVEMVMGVTPRGSYCRDLLEASRVLDMYALLGVPLRVTLGYPSSDQADRDADPEMRVDAGRWGDGFTPATQADWAESFGALALCKPPVQGVQWTHLSDAEPHQFPHCGLLDAGGAPKPALARLRELRERHLS
jgi:hypothetical protein